MIKSDMSALCKQTVYIRKCETAVIMVNTNSCSVDVSPPPAVVTVATPASQPPSEHRGGAGDVGVGEHFNPSVRHLEVPRAEGGSCGFHVTRSKWDPYPWISGVDEGSLAHAAGLRSGDCLLEVNGEDVVGMRVAAVAQLVRARPNSVSLLLWSAGLQPVCNPEALCCGPMPVNLQRLSASMAAILSAIECPICLDTIPPPALQCANGHLVCTRCRDRTDRCPVCRERYGRGRSLIADQVYNSLTDAFELRDTTEEFSPGKLRERLFGPRKTNKKSLETEEAPKVFTPSHTHKFLAKIMGKSYSVENLSTNNLQNNKMLSASNEDFCSLKIKSLSTNEIFRPESPIAIPRCPSAHRLGEGLSTKRPSSRYASSDSLDSHPHRIYNGNDRGSTTLVVPIIHIQDRDDNLVNCPCSEYCTDTAKESELLEHIISHGGPLVQWGLVAELPVPLECPLQHACFALRSGTTQFFLKVELQVEELKDSPSDLLIWCWIQASSTAAGGYLLDLTLRGGDDNTKGKELSARSAVYSLHDTTWKDIKSSRRGIFFTGETLKANFGNWDVLHLRAELLESLPCTS